MCAHVSAQLHVYVTRVSNQYVYISDSVISRGCQQLHLFQKITGNDALSLHNNICNLTGDSRLSYNNNVYQMSLFFSVVDCSLIHSLRKASDILILIIEINNICHELILPLQCLYQTYPHLMTVNIIVNSLH